MIERVTSPRWSTVVRGHGSLSCLPGETDRERERGAQQTTRRPGPPASYWRGFHIDHAPRCHGVAAHLGRSRRRPRSETTWSLPGTDRQTRSDAQVDRSDESGEFAIFFTKLVTMATSLKISEKEVQIDHVRLKRFHSVKR